MSWILRENVNTSSSTVQALKTKKHFNPIFSQYTQANRGSTYKFLQAGIVII